MSETTVRFIKTNFELPNHVNELAAVEEVIEKFKKRVKMLGIQRSITDAEHSELFGNIVKLLEYVGNLSKPAFEIEDELEQMYVIRYSHAPELGKKLWLEHYGQIHRPYNTMKNRCFTMLDILDDQYKKKYKKNPPNWE